MKMEKTKESEAFEILRDVCTRRATLDLRVFGRKKQDEYKSRFLQLDEYAELPTVTIQAPAPEGENILVPLDHEVEVSFLHMRQPHFFITLASGHGTFRVARKKIIRSLELLAPNEIVLAEKRNFYRVRLEEDRRVEIKLEILSEDDEAIRVRSREKGIITTVGGNGLGFYLPEGRSLLLNVDTRLRLRFRLQPDEEELKLLATIRFRLRRPKIREIFFGVQFIGIDSDIKYKQSVDRVLRFVAEEQRRHLSQRIHLTK
jgi:hypothetical protein